MTFWEFLLELMMIVDVPDWGWCPWWCFGLSRYALRKPCLKFGWNIMSLKASRTLSKIDDYAGGLEDAGGSWLVLVSLMVFRIVAFLVGSLSFKFHWNLFSLSWVIAWFKVSLRVGSGGSGWLGSGLGPNLGISFGWSIMLPCLKVSLIKCTILDYVKLVAWLFPLFHLQKIR